MNDDKDTILTVQLLADVFQDLTRKGYGNMQIYLDKDTDTPLYDDELSIQINTNSPTNQSNESRILIHRNVWHNEIADRIHVLKVDIQTAVDKFYDLGYYYRKRCTECDMLVPNTAKYCPQCGKKVNIYDED